MLHRSMLSRLTTYPYVACVKCSVRFGGHSSWLTPAKRRLQTPVISGGFIHNYSTSHGENVTLPPLMHCQTHPIVYPGIINSFKNMVYGTFILPYFDKEFNLRQFSEGCKQALTVISNKLAKGEFEDLEGLIEPSALSEIKTNIAKFTVAQRELLGVDERSDGIVSFPYEIGVIIPDEQEETHFFEPTQSSFKTKPKQIRHVEITVVFHVVKGIMSDVEELKRSPYSNYSNFVVADKKRVMVCNYRFFRDFTEGKDCSWIVNMINHFLPNVKA